MQRIPVAVLAGVALAAAWTGVVFARTQATAAAGVTAGSGQAQAPPAPTQAPARPSPTADVTQIPGATYIGSAACVDCHSEQKDRYITTSHGRAANPRSPEASVGCETCHGPGSKHADAPDEPGLIVIFPKLAPAEASQICLSCHTRGEHVMWDGSVHDVRKLTCTTCHSVHSFKSDHAQLKAATERETCLPCHREKVARTDRSGHMPVREGKMECSTCHNPHGATNVRLLRKGDSIAELCTSCHAEKRGPFLWEHAPSRDGCVTCHDPHGSPNERMLVSKPPILCQRCHVMTRHPSTIYDGALVGAGSNPSIRVYARSCVTCHSNIHGSNHPSGQRFIR
jgi:DmsE family decaheme c-type cytochrome